MKPLLRTAAGTYRWHEDWIRIPEAKASPEGGRTHGVAVSRAGNLYVFHQAVPAVLVYSPSGSLLDRWGDYPGAHGMTLVEEDGEEFLWLADQKRMTAEKTTLDGRVVQALSRPDRPEYGSGPYVPTWIAVDEIRHGGGGDIWLADGYGQSLVHRYDAAGRYRSTLDGTEGAGRFRCPHGIAFDSRKPSSELYVADRGNRRVQVYDGKGRFLRVFGEEFLTSPDGFASFGDRLIVPELHAQLTILDREDRLVAQLGGNEDICTQAGWPDATPAGAGKWNSPHAAAVDSQGNIFVVEWRKGGRVTKLELLGADHGSDDAASRLR